jgi:hypothetical protein
MTVIPGAPGPWVDRWKDLPLLGGSSEMPAEDGDTALLEELRDRIELAAATLTTPQLLEAFDFIELCSGSIEADTFLSDVEAWPDLAGQLLAAWKAQEAA